MSGNYTIGYTDNLTSTINKARLEVTATDVTKTYDGTLDGARHGHGRRHRRCGRR